VDLPKTGSLLDIGSGNGHFVATFIKKHPLWSATMSDKSNHQIKQSLTPVRFVANLNDLTHNNYDLITLIHTLEHLPDPISSLQKVLQLLKPGGNCLVQTPNTTASLWGCIIYDHVSHFTMTSLANAMEQSGFNTLVLSKDVSGREIALIGQKGPPPPHQTKKVKRFLICFPFQRRAYILRHIRSISILTCS
jgi:trans-aconitate methyltransferase